MASTRVAGDWWQRDRSIHRVAGDQYVRRSRKVVASKECHLYPAFFFEHDEVSAIVVVPIDDSGTGNHRVDMVRIAGCLEDAYLSIRINFDQAAEFIRHLWTRTALLLYLAVVCRAPDRDNRWLDCGAAGLVSVHQPDREIQCASTGRHRIPFVGRLYLLGDRRTIALSFM